MKQLSLIPTLTSYWSGLFLLLILLVSLQACSEHRYRNFTPEEIEEVPVSQLKRYVDTSATLSRLATYASDRDRIDSLLYFGEALQYFDEDAAQFYAQMAYDLATEKNWEFPRAVSAHRLAVLKEVKAKYNEDIEDAMVDANISKRIFDQMGREDWQVWIYSLIGRLHYRRSNLDSAQYYFERALSMLDDAPSLSDAQKMTSKGALLLDMANTYDPADPAQFLAYMRQSDSIFHILNDTAYLARLWIDVGQFYTTQGDHARADSLLQLGLDYGRRNFDNDILIRGYQARGYLSAIKYYYYRDEAQSQAALSDFQECLQLQTEGRYKTHDFLGWLYAIRASYNDYITDIDTSLYHYKLAIEEAREEGALTALQMASATVAGLCEFEEEWERCEAIFDTSTVAFLSINYAGVVDTITKHSKAAFQRTNQVEQREIVVSGDRKRRNLLFSGIGALIIAGLIFLVILQRVQRKRLEARMEALRAQINPHFFFNSLNAIESLVNHDKKREASKYIVHFSRLSRQILNRSRDPMTSLKEELSMMKRFLELEKLRFPEKLTYEINVAPDLETTKIEVPGLILQPYAENAIVHGIKPKEGPGALWIDVRTEEGKLVCIIEDDGVGRVKSAALKAALDSKRKSMGMDISKERIQRMGKVKGQSLEIVDLVDDEGNALGTRVVLQLPLKYRKEKAV